MKSGYRVTANCMNHPGTYRGPRPDSWYLGHVATSRDAADGLNGRVTVEPLTSDARDPLGFLQVIRVDATLTPHCRPMSALEQAGN